MGRVLPLGASRPDNEVFHARMGLGVVDGTRGEVEQGANGLAVAIHNRIVEEIFIETDVIPAGHADGDLSR